MNDQPQPKQIKLALEACMKQDWEKAFGPVHEIVKQGYSTTDIISTFNRVTKNMDVPENIKLEWLKEIGLTHMRVNSGAPGLLQLDAMVSKFLMTVVNK